MQQAISYKICHPTQSLSATATATPSSPSHPLPNDVMKGGSRRTQTTAAADIGKFLSENALSVLGLKGCCMATVVRRLLLGLGVNPAIYEVEEETEETTEVLAQLRKIDINLRDVDVELPVVFISGKLFGGLDRVMATHISGELVPILKDAGALWL